jgi:hypothetical protein
MPSSKRIDIIMVAFIATEKVPDTPTTEDRDVFLLWAIAHDLVSSFSVTGTHRHQSDRD